MQRLLHIVVATILAFNACGYYALYGTMLFVNESRIERLREAVPKRASLKRIVIPRGHENTQVRWTDDDEFVIDGRLFDIVREETRGDTLIAYCARDRDEESIDHRIGEHVARTAGDSAAHAARVLLDLPAPECPLIAVVTVPRPPLSSALCATCDPSPLQIVLAVTSPPPRG